MPREKAMLPGRGGRPGRAWRNLLLLLLAVVLASCSSGPEKVPTAVPDKPGVYKLGRPYRVKGRLYEPYYDPGYVGIGIASWYGPGFHGRRTANGERFDRNRLTAAHPTLPLPSLVEVTNLENGRKVVVRVNDRGPFAGNRLIDLSEAAARKLGFREKGLARVRVRFLRLADASGTPPEPTRRSRARSRSAAALTRARAEEPGCRQDRGPFYVQLGVFRVHARARAAARRVKGLAPIRFERADVGGGDAIRVMLGPIGSPAVARSMLARSRRLGFVDAYLAGARDVRPICGTAREAKLG